MKFVERIAEPLGRFVAEQTEGEWIVIAVVRRGTTFLFAGLTREDWLFMNRFQAMTTPEIFDGSVFSRLESLLLAAIVATGLALGFNSSIQAAPVIVSDSDAKSLFGGGGVLADSGSDVSSQATPQGLGLGLTNEAAQPLSSGSTVGRGGNSASIATPGAPDTEKGGQAMNLFNQPVNGSGSDLLTGTGLATNGAPDWNAADLPDGGAIAVTSGSISKQFETVYGEQTTAVSGDNLTGEDLSDVYKPSVFALLVGVAGMLAIGRLYRRGLHSRDGRHRSNHGPRRRSRHKTRRSPSVLESNPF
jgi:hypothetical protein